MRDALDRLTSYLSRWFSPSNPDSELLETLLEEERITENEYRSLVYARHRRRLWTTVILILSLMVLTIGSALIVFGLQTEATGASPGGPMEQWTRWLGLGGPDRPRVVRFTPEGEVQDLTQIMATFNRPMVGDESLNKMFDTHPVRVTPDIGARFLWTSDHNLKIIAEKPIPPGTRTTVSIPATLTDLDGRSMDREYRFTFVYKPLDLVRVNHRSYVRHRLEFDLYFNSPVTAQRLRNHLLVESEAGDTLPFELKQAERTSARHRVVISKSHFETLEGTDITFRITPGMKTARGNVPLQNALSQQIQLGRLSIYRIQPRIDGLTPYIQISFNRDIRGIDELQPYVEIDADSHPRIRREHSHSITIRSDEFTFGDTVKVTVREGLRAGLYKLERPYERTLTIPDPNPYVEIRSRGVFQSASGQKVLPVQYVNTDTLYVTTYQIYPDNLVYFANRSRYKPEQEELFQRLTRRVYTLPGRRNRVETEYLNLNDLVGGRVHGPKILQFNHPGSHRLNDQLLVVSDLGITYKQIGDQIVVLVSSLARGVPVSGARVSVYSPANQRLVRGQTDGDGLVQFDGVSYEHGRPSVVVARRGEDVNYLHVSEGHLSTVGFDVEGDPYPRGDSLEVFVHGEREIYRPGETVHLKVLARGFRLRTAPDIPLHATITGPEGRTVLERTLQTGDLGTATLNYPSREDASTGEYTVRITLPSRERTVGSGQFQIESFVPDRIETRVRAETGPHQLGDTVRVDLSGRYLYGEPTSGNRFEGVYSLVPVPFRPDGYDSYRFGDGRIEFQELFERLEPGALDERGRGSYEIDIPTGLRPPSDLRLVVTGTVFEAGARGVSDRDTARIHPYPHYIGLNMLTQQPDRLDPEEPVSFEIVALRPDGSRIDSMDLEVKLYRREWNYVLKEDPQGRVKYEWDREDVLSQTSRLTLDNGSRTVEITPGSWGEYVLVVENPNSNVRSAYPFHVGWWWQGKQAGEKVNFDRVELTLDRSTYRPGQTARVELRSPYAGTAYVFLEGREIAFLRRIPLDDRTAQFTFPVRAEHAPNVYLNVFVLRGTHEAQFESYRAVGLTPVPVERPDRRMNVRLSFPRGLDTGETRPVAIRLEDSDGRPVDGEVALSVVDQGILQLSEKRWGTAYDYFFRKRSDNVHNADVFSRVRSEPDTDVQRRLTPSGAAREMRARRHRSPVQIRDPRTVSQWFPSLAVNNGQTTLSLPVPEFSGTLTFRAWAVGPDRVGYESSQKTVREPVIVQATLPRALSPGDSASVTLEIRSNLPQPAEFDLDLDHGRYLETRGKPESIRLEPDRRRRVQFTLRAGERTGPGSLSLWLRSQERTVKKSYDIAVRPPYPFRTESEFFAVRAGQTVDTSLSRVFDPGEVRSTVAVSRRPDVKLMAGLEHVIRYPYGCVEQITSQVFPQLYLSSLLRQARPELTNREEIRRNVNEGIRRILEAALPDGTFSKWPGGGSTYDYGTLYTSHFLVEAHRAGYPVPESTRARIRALMRQWIRDSKNDRIRAYAVYILALQGDYQVPVARKLLREMDEYERYYLVAALVMAGRGDTVREDLYTRTPPVEEVNRQTEGVLRSQTLGEAVILNALLDAGESVPMIEALAARLLRGTNVNGHWGTTHENALALVALGKYFKRQAVAEPDFSGTLIVNGQHRIRFDSRSDTAVALDTPVRRLRVDSQGTGTVHVSLHSEGTPTPEHRGAVSQGMSLRHRFYDLKGNPVDRTRFERGGLYIVETSVRIPSRNGNLYLEDILPGGFELENPRIATRTRDIPFLNEDVITPEYMDIQDDRIVVFFGASDSKQIYRYKYLVRAVHPGVYTYPALSSGCMYDPSLRAIQPLDPVEIR